MSRYTHTPARRRVETTLVLTALALILALPPGALTAVIALPAALGFAGWIWARSAARAEARPLGHMLRWRCDERHHGDGSWRK